MDTRMIKYKDMCMDQCLGVHRDMCVDQSLVVYRDMCTDQSLDVYSDMCSRTDKCIDKCIKIRMTPCTGTCTDKGIGMCTDKYIDTCKCGANPELKLGSGARTQPAHLCKLICLSVHMSLQTRLYTCHVLIAFNCPRMSSITT